jgi:serine/threonine protein phosphatase PrpC
VGLSAGFATNRGLVRQTNEDSFLVRKGLYVVCDGMGGARGGEVASQMACERMVVIDPASAGQDELRAAIVEANESISARSLSEPRLLGMGTTLTSALIRDHTALLGHVGDSRAYLLRDGALRQLTDDHSWVGEMVRRGELTEAEAAVHPHRSVITKALGTEGEADPDLVEVALEPGDRLLLCSDGLSGMVSKESIQELLRRPDGAQAVADALVEAALKGGGEDNVTVVVVDLAPDEGPSAVPADAGTVGSGDGGDTAEEGKVILGPTERGQERSSVPGFMRPALGMGAKLTRRPPIWARPAPQASPDAKGLVKRRRRPSRKWIVTAAVVVIIVALAIAAFVVFNSNVYYVGTSDGMVALYQGLPATLLGIHLSSVVELGTVSYDSLAQFQRERVDAHDLVGKEEGQGFLRGLAALQ